MTTRAYNVSGMTGGHCVNAVSSAIAGVTGVSDVDVDLARGIHRDRGRADRRRRDPRGRGRGGLRVRTAPVISPVLRFHDRTSAEW